MHKAKHQLHIRHANRLHVLNYIVSAVDPLLTKPVLAIIYLSIYSYNAHNSRTEHCRAWKYYVQEHKN